MENTKHQQHGIKRILSAAMAVAVAASSFSVPQTAFAEQYDVIYSSDGTVSNEWDGSVASDFDGGTGTENDPYKIANGEQLALLAQYVDSKSADYVTKYYILTADILLNDDINVDPNRWNSIGSREENDWPDTDTDRFFYGTFNGDGHKIIGLYQDQNSTGYAYGLFANIGTGAVIKDLTVTDGKIVTDRACMGAICGYSAGKISNCTNDGVDIEIVESSEMAKAGGICGLSYGGTIEN